MSGMPLDADELAAIFGYRNRRGVNRDVRRGVFPVPTYQYNGQRFAHADHVNEWLERKKAEAQAEFDALMGDEVEEYER